MNTTTRTIGIIILTSGLSACGSMTNTEAGTAIGAAGDLIGHEIGEDKDRAERRRR